MSDVRIKSQVGIVSRILGGVNRILGYNVVGIEEVVQYVYCQVLSFGRGKYSQFALREFLATPAVVNDVVVDVDHTIQTTQVLIVFQEVSFTVTMSSQSVEGVVFYGNREVDFCTIGRCALSGHIKELVAVEIHHKVFPEYKVVHFVVITVDHLDKGLSVTSGRSVPAHIVEFIVFEYHFFNDGTGASVRAENPLVIHILEGTISNGIIA
ncbi:MAG: hypothetical protein BWY95_02006 [Bacteroidetes bacterium ADurb.BinA104]|nr:MAG: hypothetical protein BWY95_02006 [Bacteroidetes bacterium ADurb.BinA104]